MSGLEKTRRRIEAYRKRVRANLAEIGVDLDDLTSEDAAVLRRAESQTARLREMAARMRRASEGAGTGPTPERLAHAPAAPRVIDTGPDRVPAHRFDWALDAIRERIERVNPNLYQVAGRLRDCHLAMQPRSAVADPSGVGGSSDPSRRLPITERHELAAREFGWVMDRMAEASFRRCVQNFVLEMPPEGAERCLSVLEWGRKATGYASEVQAYPAGVASIIAALERLQSIYHAFQAWERDQCTKTDRLMRSDIGRRAASGGWIVALWDFARAKGRLPVTQGEVDQIRASHDSRARAMRQAPPMDLERWHRARDRLTGIAFRDDETRVRVA